MWFFDHWSIRKNTRFSSQSFPSDNTAGVLSEDLHSQEYIQLFDIHNCLFMRLHFSIGGYDYRRTTRFRQSIHFSINQVLFADHVHWRSGVDNKFSFLRFQRWCKQAPIFPKVRRMLLFDAPVILTHFGQLPRCSAGTLLLPLCLFLWTILKFRSVGATLMRFTWTNEPNEGILVSNFGMTCNSLCELHTLDRLRHVSALPENRLRRRHVLKYATQVSCIRRLTLRWILSQFLFTSLPRPPRSIVTSIGDRFLPISVFQHSHSTFVIIRFRPFRRLLSTWRCANAHFFPKPTATLGLVEQAFWRMPSFTEWVIASSSKVILARPSWHSTTGTSASGTSGSRGFSLTLPHERIRRRIWWRTFSTLVHIVAETAIVSFHTLPVGFPLPTISKNSLYTLFCSLILDHGVLLKISNSVPKILISNFLLDTSLHHSFQSVTIRS